MQIPKEIIRPGKTAYIHPKTGDIAVLDATPEYIDYLYRSGNAMRAKGISIPLPLEHQPTAKAMTVAERAAATLLSNAGDLVRFEKKDDILFGIFDIKDPVVAEKIKNETIRWTSPWITSFVDGDGQSWRNVISHVALTSTPRITKQQPFPTMDAAMSMVGTLPPIDVKTPEEGICLSLAGNLSQKDGKLAPNFPEAFALWTGIKLSMEDDEEEEMDEEPKKKGRVSPLDKVADTVVDESHDVKIHETICHLLKALGFAPPDGMDESTFERDVYETLMAKVQELGAKALAGEKKEEEVPTDPKKIPVTNPVMQESPPMYASLAEIEKIADPKEKFLAGAMFSLHQENQRYKNHALNLEKVKRDQRIERIASKIPAAQRDTLLKLAGSESAALSLSDTGAVNDPLDSMLGILEASIKDTPTLLQDGTFTLEKHPTDGEFTEDRRKAVVEEMMQNNGYKK